MGSIGQRLARLINAKFSYELYYFCRTPMKKPITGMQAIHTWAEIKSRRIDIAFITNPTSEHIKYAKKCAEIGLNLFIEKPIGLSTNEVLELRDLARQNMISCYVGYHLRFHPVIKWLKENIKTSEIIHTNVICCSYLPNWRPGINYKENYSASKSMGGGVILDLSHEIDYVDYLAGEILEIKANSARVSDITIDSEDFADIILKHEKAYTSIHLSYFSHAPKREIRIDCTNKTVIGNILSNRIDIHSESDHKVIQFDDTLDAVYLKELTYFFNNCGKPMMNDLEEGTRIFKSIMKVRECIL